MRREYEERPTDTKVLRETFRSALERKMNSLINEGYRPSGGIAAHTNTNIKPVLGATTQEYIQTMVKYERFEVWVKESEKDWEAFKLEKRRNHLKEEVSRLKISVKNQLLAIRTATEKLERSKTKLEAASDSFFGKITQSSQRKLIKRYESELKSSNEIILANKLEYRKDIIGLEELNTELQSYYTSNPSLDTEILLNSK